MTRLRDRPSIRIAWSIAAGRSRGTCARSVRSERRAVATSTRLPTNSGRSSRTAPSHSDRSRPAAPDPIRPPSAPSALNLAEALTVDGPERLSYRGILGRQLRCPPGGVAGPEDPSFSSSPTLGPRGTVPVRHGPTTWCGPDVGDRYRPWSRAPSPSCATPGIPSQATAVPRRHGWSADPAGDRRSRPSGRS